MIARYEAEFCGRLLIGPADLSRWRSEPPDALTWGILGVAGLDHLVREHADLKQLASIFHRGVRVFQLVETANNHLAGSAEPGDDRGLTELGRACVSEIAGLAAMTVVKASDPRSGSSEPAIDGGSDRPGRSAGEIAGCA